MKNASDEITSTLNIAKKSVFKDMSLETSQTEKREKKRMKQRAEYPRTVNTKGTTYRYWEYPKEKKDSKKQKKCLKEYRQNFLKLMTDTNPQIQEAGRTPSSLSTKKIYTEVYHIQSEKKKAKMKSQRKPEGRDINQNHS